MNQHFASLQQFITGGSAQKLTAEVVLDTSIQKCRTPIPIKRAVGSITIKSAARFSCL
jgi:hypothetical protein